MRVTRERELADGSQDDDSKNLNYRGIHMKSKKRAIAVGCITALAGIVSAPNAFATGACYAFESSDPQIETAYDGPPIVLRYIPKSHGSINTDTEARQLKHLRQTAYALAGKATALFDYRCENNDVTTASCPGPASEGQVRLMTTIDGTIIVGRPLAGVQTPDSPGAHMGINMHLLRRVLGGYISIGPVDLECTTPQTSATPAYWRCNIRVELDVPFYNGIFWQLALNDEVTLVKVNSNQTAACSVFQDGEPVVYQD